VKLKITIDSKLYEVEVEAEDEAPQRPSGPAVYAPARVAAPVAAAAPPPAPAAGANGGPAVADESKVCRSPIVGIVVSVSAQEGQQVQVNDPLLVLEAMKMETTITSPATGRVKKIHCAAGDSVQANQVLVEFE
jgi:methylmalonyl-CoA carboxyltransferase small subunit